MRLDNILFRVGFAPTIPAARQLINHGHVSVNGHKVNIPSYNCQYQDHIMINKKKESSHWITQFLNEEKETNLIPSHLIVNKNELQITVLNNFQYQEVGLSLNELLIIEYYSRS